MTDLEKAREGVRVAGQRLWLLAGRPCNNSEWMAAKLIFDAAIKILEKTTASERSDQPPAQAKLWPEQGDR